MTNSKNAKKKKVVTEKKNRKNGNDAKKKISIEDGGKRVVADAKMNKDSGKASVSFFLSLYPSSLFEGFNKHMFAWI